MSNSLSDVILKLKELELAWRKFEAEAEGKTASFEEDMKKARAEFDAKIKEMSSQDLELRLEKVLRKMAKRSIRIVKVDALDKTPVKSENGALKSEN